ncbi:CaiB/BaiF CoA transferase family protein [Candidatus Entotheonella palauensis]|uniref:CaiB/BaiF CoA transferase family protein n=1 Tax=Candidatus Entotheonella palauensis TaxID=93172 RepID=UPI000B7FA640|nr:CoA transferase [Candidatus Entotheonella palauensis]
MASTLDGITVLDLSTGPAGSLATMFLSDHGARVIRLVDIDDTAPRRGGYLVWDRGKSCIRLDFSQLGPQDNDAPGSSAEAFIKLIRSSDILVEDFAPSSERQRMVDADWLSGLNPRLIHCSITAYGKHGPWKDEPPIDVLVMARMGILGSQPGFRPAPVHVVHPLPSSGAAILANLGIAASLLAREQTGRGRKVETSLMGGALLYHPKVTGEHIESRGFQTNPSGSAPFYSNYECADGEYVQLGCVHEKFINIAADLFGLTEALKEPRFGNGRMPQTEEADIECRALVAQAVRTKPYAEWAKMFEESDVPFARCQVSEDSMADPQVQFNNMVVELQDPEVGPLTQMGVPIHFSETPGHIQGPRVPPAQAASTLPDDLTDVASATHGQAGQDGPFDPPLKGIRILEITNLIAGPTGGRLLADLRADVIKFEPLAGDISRPIGRTYFFNVNANKRSVSVDTRTPEGKEVAQKIAASADAVLANLRPHATERMGIGPAINPNLIETHLTGYGWTGPYSKRPGIDPLAQGLMGLQRAQGGKENPPVFPAQLAPTDYTTGAMGALGTILAIYTRLRTGVVQRVDSNLLNGGAVLSSEWFTRYEGKPERPLADKGQYGLGPFHRLYQVSDGWIYVAADTETEREAMCKAVDAEALLSAHQDTAGASHLNDTPLAQALAEKFTTVQADDILKRLKTAGVPCAPALPGDSELFLNDPHASANDMIATYDHAWAGKLLVAWRYVQFGHTKPVEGKSTPLLGEQNREVLREVGFSDEAIDELYAKGVIKTETPA